MKNLITDGSGNVLNMLNGVYNGVSYIGQTLTRTDTNLNALNRMIAEKQQKEQLERLNAEQEKAIDIVARDTAENAQKEIDSSYFDAFSNDEAIIRTILSAADF